VHAPTYLLVGRLSAMAAESDRDLLADLQPVAEQLLERHLAASREWHPHTFVPWSRGRDFEPDYQWSETESTLSPEVRSALFVNLLTEDNLPYYFRDVNRMFGAGEAWGEWTRRWTAEEGRHATVIRDYLTVTRAIDPVALERGRMIQMSKGEVPEPPTALDGLIYLTLQELATRISHHNTGKLIDDPVGYQVMKRVASDENHHFLFYRDAAKAAIERDPSSLVLAMERQVVDFDMPGTGIPDYNTHAKAIANAGIYDFALHYEQILEPIVLRYWGLQELEGLTGEAEASRERILASIERTRRVGQRLKERREKRQHQLSTV
jgi:acyl-[acyl-carrier-protein] desaturase